MLDKFNGDPVKCRGFLIQRQLYLTSHGDLADHSKTVLMMGLLPGKALTWATVIWEKGGEPMTSYECFSMFRRIFDHVREGKEVGDRLMSIQQGNQ